MEIKNKKCKVCGVEFKPFRTFQNCCSEAHTRQLAEEKKKVKEERGQTKKKSDRLLKLELAKITFNAFIRERDRGKPCICCGKPLGENYQAGHAFSGGGHSNVLFDEDNVHAQRFDCNNDRAGNVTEYFVRLEKHLGATGFELLRARAYEAKSWTVEELDAIIKYYREKTKELKAR